MNTPSSSNDPILLVLDRYENAPESLTDSDLAILNEQQHHILPKIIQIVSENEIGSWSYGMGFKYNHLGKLLVSFEDKTLEYLHESLQTDSFTPTAKIWLAYILGVLADKSFVPVIMQLLKDPDSHVRAQAALALGWNTTEVAIKMLEEIYNHESNPAVLRNVTRAISMIGPSMMEVAPTILRSLTARFSSQSYSVKEEIINALGHFDTSEAASCLVNLLSYTQHPELRSRIIVELHRYARTKNSNDLFVSLLLNERNRETRQILKKIIDEKISAN